MFTLPAHITSNAYITSNAQISSASVLTINGDFIEFKPSDQKNAKIITNKHTINLDLLYETVQLLAQRLSVLAADEDVLAKHPSLRDAYDQYQLLSNLITPNKKEYP